MGRALSTANAWPIGSAESAVPHDEYAVVLDIIKMDINKGIASSQFVLTQPEGTTLRIIGQPPAAPADRDLPGKGSNH